MGSEKVLTERRQKVYAKRDVLEQVVGGSAYVREEKRAGGDVVFCDDRVSVGSERPRWAHLDCWRGSCDKALAGNSVHAVQEGRFECFDESGDVHISTYVSCITSLYVDLSLSVHALIYVSATQPCSLPSLP